MKLEADGGFGVGGTHTHTIDNGQVMNGAIRDVDDMLVSTTKAQTTTKNGTKLDHAKEVGHKTTDKRWIY